MIYKTHNRLCQIFAALIIFAFTLSKVNSASIKSADKITKENAMIFLEKFGYTGGASNQKSTKLIPKDVAIKEYQSYFGLRQTGKLDNDTLKEMNKPRCGVSDKNRFEIIASRWRTNDVTYRILNYPRNFNPEVVQIEIARAFRLWSDQTNLRFIMTTSPSSVNIAIQFAEYHHGDVYPFDGPGGVLAHASGPPSGDTHFDASERWTINTTGTDLFLTAAHEFGHALGLGHSNQRGSLMWPTSYGYVPNFKLHPDDVAGIQALYGRKVVTPPPRTTPAWNVPRQCTRHAHPVKIVTALNGHSVAISGNKYWKLSSNNVAEGESRQLTDAYPGLPTNLDAGFSIIWGGQTESHTYFFKGAKYWRYSTRGLDTGFPKHIRDGFRGLPDDLDAAFVLKTGARGSHLYFFKGHLFWRFNTVEIQVDPGYPKQISNSWKGLPNHVDGAITIPSGSAYFTKGSRYYKLNQNDFSVAEMSSPITSCS